MSFNEDDKYFLHNRLRNYLNLYGLFENIWVFPSGGKIPNGMDIWRIPSKDKLNLLKIVRRNRELKGKTPHFNKFTWGDYVAALPESQYLKGYVLEKINDYNNTLSIKLGPTYPDSNKYLMSLDLDLKESWKGFKIPESLRQELCLEIIECLRKVLGRTLVTGSRSDGYHIIYATNIPQTTAISNTVVDLMGFYFNDDIDYNFSVDYKCSDHWLNMHHTTIYGERKEGGYFGLFIDAPIKYIEGLTKADLIKVLLNEGLINYSKDLRNERNAVQRSKTLKTRIENKVIK